MRSLGSGTCFAWSAWLCLACVACSIDQTEHEKFRKDDCDEKTETRIGVFCIPKRKPDAGAPKKDAGDADVQPGDAGGDSAIDVDATTPEPCDEPDAGELCYPFTPISTALQQPCRAGTRNCGANKLWGRCKNAVGPSQDTCDGVDNDCDGKTDEAQLVMTCTVPGVMGVCAEEGFAVCRAGEQQCRQLTFPMSETCNGKDDDCDGNTDEGLEIACYDGDTGCTANSTGGFDCVPASSCAPGKLRCVDRVMETACSGDVRPAAEVATKKDHTPIDEDCDGKIDEGFSCQNGQDYPCYTGPANTQDEAPCKAGKQQCVGGQFGACMDERTPQPETCANEGEDDDCNGTEDDIAKRGTSCSGISTGKGVCKQKATWQCQGGGEVCQNGQSSNEVCDGLNQDEDCDGKVDEGFDLQTNKDNCGACGNRCANDLICCGGSCVSTASSNSNCGMCGKICAAGLTCCNGNCVNLKTDSNNCGSCGRGCLLLGCGNGGCL